MCSPSSRAIVRALVAAALADARQMRLSTHHGQEGGARKAASAALSNSSTPTSTHTSTSTFYDAFARSCLQLLSGAGHLLALRCCCPNFSICRYCLPLTSYRTTRPAFSHAASQRDKSATRTYLFGADSSENAATAAALRIYRSRQRCSLGDGKDPSGHAKEQTD